MSDIFLELKSTLLFIRDKNSEIVGHCFVITFPGDKDNKSTRPFLVTSCNVNSFEDCYIEFPVIDGLGHRELFKQPINESLVFKFNQNGIDVLVVPIAFVYNVFSANKLAIDFKTIPESLIINDVFVEKMSTYESICMFSYNQDMQDVAFYRKNSLSEVKNSDTFYIDNQGVNYIGSPVFIFDQSTYVENNSINIGSRLFLIGLSVQNFGGVLKIQSAKKLIELLKQRFNFDTKFEQ